jgi:CHASE3 domain sensor protein
MKIIKRLPWGHIGYWAAAVVIAVMGGTLYKAFVDKKDSAARVASTLEVLNGIGGINESLARAESAQRGFLLSADKAFIGQRDEALILMGHHIEGVSRLTADNAHQQGKIAQLDRLIEERIKIMRTNEETRIARR